jgi:hypothetical protein
MQSNRLAFLTKGSVELQNYDCRLDALHS